MTPYSIQLPVYEGPLDLLLDLIERAELDITKVALAQVTSQYLDHLRQLSEHQIADLASFLVIAARLLQIKSEALLPRPPVRELGEEDPGDALARQLMEYKRFKEVAGQLGSRQEAGLRTFLRLARAPLPEPKLDLGGVTLESLRRALADALAQARPDMSASPDVQPPVVRLRDMIRWIVQTIQRAGRTEFRQMLRRARTRLEVIVSFLAVLELMKQGQIHARQDELFGDIEIVPGPDWNPDQAEALELEFEE